MNEAVTLAKFKPSEILSLSHQFGMESEKIGTLYKTPEEWAEEFKPYEVGHWAIPYSRAVVCLIFKDHSFALIVEGVTGFAVTAFEKTDFDAMQDYMNQRHTQAAQIFAGKVKALLGPPVFLM